MIDRRFIRICMAAVMAIWSPAWCQCMVLAAAVDAQATHATDASLIDTATSVVAVDDCADGDSHDSFHVADVDALATADLDCCPGACDETVDGSMCTCVCCDQRSTTPAIQISISIDAVDNIDIEAAHFFTLLAEPPPVGLIQSTSMDQRAGPPLVLRSTLLSQRCALLI